MPQSRRGWILSPLQSGTAGLTLSLWLDVSFLFTCSVPCATSPLAPLSDLLPLAVALWGSFARLFVVLSPPGPLFLLVLGRAFLTLCLFLVFSLGSSLAGSSLLCFSGGVSACDFAVVFSLAFVCRLWCCGASLFAVGGSPPPLTVVSLPPAVVPLWRPGPVTVRVPPSGYLVARAGPTSSSKGALRGHEGACPAPHRRVEALRVEGLRGGLRLKGGLRRGA